MSAAPATTISCQLLDSYDTWKLRFRCSCSLPTPGRTFSHMYRHTNTCLAITILTLPAVQLYRVSVSGSEAHFSTDHCQNIKWIMRCGQGGAAEVSFSKPALDRTLSSAMLIRHLFNLTSTNTQIWHNLSAVRAAPDSILTARLVFAKDLCSQQIIAFVGL